MLFKYILPFLLIASSQSALQLRKNDNSNQGNHDTCCDRVKVKAIGNARIDQPLYIGVYNKIAKEYNGRSVYQSEGDKPLYIYFFQSARDRIKLWVIGPKVGKLIAGINNSKTSQCVNQLGSGWKYASKAGIWKDNDSSLNVKCLGNKQTTIKRKAIKSRKTMRKSIQTTKAEGIFGIIVSMSKLTTLEPEQKNFCCAKVSVIATGKARVDQPLYVGVYNKVSRDYNGRPVYQSEGNEPLYIYFFYSTTDRISLWVIGPKVGKLIAAISNSKASQCVNKLGSGWKYASRDGVWKDDDPSLKVKCLDGKKTATTKRPITSRKTTKARPLISRKTTTTRSTTSRKTTTTRPTTSRKITTKRPLISRTSTPRRPLTSRKTITRKPTEGTKITTFKTRQPGQDCKWSPYGPWSECSRSCDRGVKVRVRRVLRQARGGGKPCRGGNRERKYCNNKTCPSRRLTSRPDTTSRRPPTTTRPITQRTTSLRPKTRPTTSRTTSLRSKTRTTTTRSSLRLSTQRPNSTIKKKTSSKGKRVACYVCGSLFSMNVQSCTGFNEDDPGQQRLCKIDEACLYYSWTIKEKTSTIRECVSRSTLIGTINNQVQAADDCQPVAVESPYIQACICTSNLCNSYRQFHTIGTKDKNRVLKNDNKEIPRVNTFKSSRDNKEIPRRNTLKRSRDNKEIPRTKTLKNSRDNKEIPRTKTLKSSRDNKEIPRTKTLKSSRGNNQQSVNQFFHPDRIGLQCYACGSLLNTNNECDKFNRRDAKQVQTCLTDEVCLMYSWKKSPTERATLRECVPTRFLLGSIHDPLLPSSKCSRRDITENGSGDIFACLCNTDFCNDDLGQI